uniref:Hdr-like menaquinol-oxidizing enzyme, subunit E (HmeE) n=1 Tax=uncultured sulfate-reducing bacterium TaxID=153939 RepID=Q3IBS1_9BACT|nr:Hdr-like menaquinol-oxidizing enzyme, subunit E (HmeE) [uncultured sulfate-reducing bacterium]
MFVFAALATSPLWLNAISEGPATAPEIKPPPNGAVNCVKDKTWMRSSHMDLLNHWRDDVVRRDDRWYVFEADGVEKTVEKSLTATCLSCHSNKADFCDACHAYTAVDPYCWDCHIVPKEVL